MIHKITLAVACATIAFLLPVDAKAADHAVVKGWANGNGAGVSLFSADGTPLKPSPGAPPVAGLHEWNADLDLIQIGPKLWAQTKDLDLIFCVVSSATVKMEAPGASGTRSATSYGSGAKCPQ